MENQTRNNALLISAYCTTKSNVVYRQYYVVFNGIYAQVECKSDKDFIKNNLKNCSVYAYEQLKKVIVGEITLNDIRPVTYKEYVAVYSGK